MSADFKINVTLDVIDKAGDRVRFSQVVEEGSGLKEKPIIPYSVNETTELLDDMPEFTGTTREKLLSAVQD